MKPGIVQKIFNDHYSALNAARRLDRRSRWAAWNIRTCRTSAQGYHIDACPNGHYQILLNNSCRHRACPLCGATETELWLERQSAKELRCPHHQVVITSPAILRELWRWNRKAFTTQYFRAAWHTLRELLGDKRRFGGLLGAIGVFQS
ncbi:MAG: transposase zinc-binding domain-containing protein [Bacteroidales bacterium]|nr:transposase zinc-binding domain-containing protein [Bacteroidales bacterium]